MWVRLSFFWKLVITLSHRRRMGLIGSERIGKRSCVHSKHRSATLFHSDSLPAPILRHLMQSTDLCVERFSCHRTLSASCSLLASLGKPCPMSTFLPVKASKPGPLASLSTGHGSVQPAAIEQDAKIEKEEMVRVSRSKVEGLEKVEPETGLRTVFIVEMIDPMGRVIGWLNSDAIWSHGPERECGTYWVALPDKLRHSYEKTRGNLHTSCI